MPSVVDPLRIVDGQNVLKGDLREFYGGAAAELNVGGFYRALAAGAVERLAQDKYRDFRDVSDFSGGDARTRIQRALDEAGKNEFGGCVYLPDGGHFLDAPGVTIPSRVFLVGNGRSSTLVRTGSNQQSMIRADPTGELFGVAHIGIFGSRQGSGIFNTAAIDFQLADDEDILGDSVWGLNNSRFLVTNIYCSRYQGRSMRVSGAGGGQIRAFFSNQPQHNGWDILADNVFCLDLKCLGARAIGLNITGDDVKVVASKWSITGIDDIVNTGLKRGVGLYCSGDRCTIEGTYGQDTNNTGFLFEGGTGHNVVAYADASGQANTLSAGRPRRDPPYISNTLSVVHCKNCSDSIFYVGARDRGTVNVLQEFSNQIAAPKLNGCVVIEGSSSCQFYCTTEVEALVPDGGISYPTYGPNTSAQTGTKFSGPGSLSNNGVRFLGGNSNIAAIATVRNSSRRVFL